MPPKTMASYPKFDLGQEVEITSREHKMRGTLFPGRVLRRTPTANNKLMVEYTTLSVNNGDGFKPLIEPVELGLVRPTQPRDSHYTLKLSDQVDAFFGGGWWEGVITEVLENSTYMVYFRFAKQQFAFEKSKLRIHREWVKGSWVPPLQQEFGERSSTSGANSSKLNMHQFRKGTQVEITSDEDGFEGSWFAATIMEKVRKDKYIVQYERLRTDDDAEFLQEEVNSWQIRPYPPEAVVVDNYNPNEKVDAFCNDGWWEGVITKVLANSKYRVYFKNSDEELKMEHSMLRPHQDWIDGKWVLASNA